MMSDDNLEALEEAGHQYVIAAKLRSMPSELKEKILDEKQYTIQLFEDDVGWVDSGEFLALQTKATCFLIGLGIYRYI